jgi:hypothetical protein
VTQGRQKSTKLQNNLWLVPDVVIIGLIYLKNFGIFLEDRDLGLLKIIAKTMPNHRTPLELIPKVSRYGNFSQPM